MNPNSSSSGMSYERPRRARKWNLPLTYKPKLQGVHDGTICQTIRRGRTYQPGDLIAFHGWAGKPYRSHWTDRSTYFCLYEVIPCRICLRGVRIGNDLFGWDSPFCDGLARQDGIVPPTGPTLAKVLGKFNNKLNDRGFEAQIIRWTPPDRQEVAP